MNEECEEINCVLKRDLLLWEEELKLIIEKYYNCNEKYDEIKLECDLLCGKVVELSEKVEIIKILEGLKLNEFLLMVYFNLKVVVFIEYLMGKIKEVELKRVVEEEEEESDDDRFDILLNDYELGLRK